MIYCTAQILTFVHLNYEEILKKCIVVMKGTCYNGVIHLKKEGLYERSIILGCFIIH